MNDNDRRSDAPVYPTEDFLGIVVSEDEIKDIINSVSHEISRDYKGKKLLLCGVLTGAYIFLSDLSRKLKIPHEVAFIKASSYGAGSESNGNISVTEITDIERFAGYSLLIVDDIYDSGNTAHFLLEYFSAKGFADIHFCALLEKPARAKKRVTLKYCGKKVANEFIVGYGLDYDEKYRYLPFLASLRREVYEK